MNQGAGVSTSSLRQAEDNHGIPVASNESESERVFSKSVGPKLLAPGSFLSRINGDDPHR